MSYIVVDVEADGEIPGRNSVVEEQVIYIVE